MSGEQHEEPSHDDRKAQIAAFYGEPYYCEVCGADPVGRCDPPDEYDGECPYGCNPER